MQRQVPIPQSEPDKAKEGVGQRKLPPLPAKTDTLNKLDKAIKQKKKTKPPRKVLVCSACLQGDYGVKAARDHYHKGTPWPLMLAEMTGDDASCKGAHDHIGGRAPHLSPDQRVRLYSSPRWGNEAASHKGAMIWSKTSPTGMKELKVDGARPNADQKFTKDTEGL